MTRFVFVVLAVAVGVGALTGVRAFSQAFRAELLSRARSILAADLSATQTRTLSAHEQQQVAALTTNGITMTRVSSTVSMASSTEDQNPLLVALKIVDPQQYPYYGKVTLASGRALRNVLNDNSVVVGQDLLIRLSTHVGSTLQVGGSKLTIADVVTGEPDALTESFGLGPRVLITPAAAEKAGLLSAGSRATERYLFKLAPGTDLQTFRIALSKALPEASIADFRESNPTITEALDRATSVLSLVSLVALVLGAIAVAMAMHAHLQQRLDNIAMMKSLGATSSHILRIYVLQTLMLGCAGGILGVALGIGVDRLLPLLIVRFIDLHPTSRISWSAGAIGFFTGLVTTQLFTLPALLSVRRVKPSHVLRRAMADEESNYAPPLTAAGIRQRAPQIGAALLLMASLATVAALLTDSAANGIRFAAGLAGAVLGLLAAAWVLLRVLRVVLRRTGLRLPSSLRHGLANLYRPGNQTASVLTALGLGVMLSMTVYLVERSVVRDLAISSPRDLPNVYLVDISPQEINGVVQLVGSLPGLEGKVQSIPVVAARMDSVDGQPPTEHREAGEPPLGNRRRRTMNLSWSEQQPDGLKIVAGNWWQAGERGSVVSVSERTAQRYVIHVGSSLAFNADGRDFTANVVALHKYNSLRAGSRSEFLFPEHALQGFPAIWYGTAHFSPAAVSTVQRTLFQKYPSVTVVNLADALAIFQAVVANIARTIEFLAAFCIFSAVILLASSVAGTRFRRIREIVVLKTLGATRARIGAVLSTEFLLLGALGAAVGLLFAELLARTLVGLMKLPFHLEPRAVALAIVCTALLAAGAGWAACFRILGQKPLSVLREE